MKMRHLSFPMLLALAACSGDHPLAGSWSQHTGTDAEGMTLQFDAGSDKLMVHTAPRADGGHDHVRGTYAFDATTMRVTVQAKLMGDDKPGAWTGTLADGDLELAAGELKLEFHKGGDAHGH